MRLAILVAPRGLGARNAEGRAELERALARVGFVVVAVWDEAQLMAQLRAGPTPDTLLVVASGPLVDAGDGVAIALSDGSAPPMRVARMVDAVAMRGARSVLVVVEVTHDAADDALAAAERVDELRTAVDARAHGASALVAVRAAGRTASPLAFTERLMRLAEEARAAGDDPRVTLDQAKAKDLYSQASKIVVQNAYYIFLQYQEVISIHRADLQGFTMNPVTYFYSLRSTSLGK